MTDKEFLLAVLADGKPKTQAEILRASFAERGHGFTIHSRASDLRGDGYRIECSHVPGAERGAAWTYRLVSPLTAPSVEPPQWASDGAVSGAHPEPQADDKSVLAASTLGPSGSAPSQLALDVPRSAYREEAA